MHTLKKPKEKMKDEFNRWEEIMTNNKQNKSDGKQLEGSLIEFFSNKGFRVALD